QDPDVLDTWFSSGIWPFATLGWPKETPDLRYFYPGDVLVTANEILFLWVARMVMMGLHFLGDVPFTDVYVAPTVMTIEGRRMSKSLGTGIDPLEMADGRGYGADAIRFALVSRCSQAQQDLRFSEKMIADTRNFSTKIWNAARFVLMNLDGFQPRRRPAADHLGPADRWIRSRYAQTVRTVTEHLEAFEFDKASRALYEFIWGEYCDWYLEMAKVDLQGAPAGSPRREAIQHTLWATLSGAMTLLHPVMPFLTDEVWQQLPHEGDSLMIAPWPAPDAGAIDTGLDKQMELLMAVVRTIRSLRAEIGIPPAQRIPVRIRTDAPSGRLLTPLGGHLSALGRTEPVTLEPLASPRPAGSVTAVLSGVEVSIPLGGLVDPARERERLGRALRELEAELGGLQHRLGNPDFVGRAPAEVVERERARAADLRARQERLREITSALGDERPG
ncbi:MAG TPA: class I tRNA ligase family protein, partial [bacterium]|nr:class I tRNA ligase family protein [bacterium]